MAGPLYDCDVPLCIRQKGREDKYTHVRVTLSLHTHATELDTKELRIRLTEGSDPYFLYFLHVHEASYQGLRDEQGLLVDFATFPHDLVRLFESVRTTLASSSNNSPDSDGKHDGQFLAFLSADPSSTLGELSIVETNPLRFLSHLTLKLRQGDDEHVKAYLAEQLALTRDSEADLFEQLAAAEATYVRDVSALRESLAATQEKLAVADAEGKEALAQAQLDAQRQAGKANADASRTIERIRAELGGKLEADRKAAAKAAAAAASALDNARDRIDSLVDANTRLENQVASLSEALDSTRAELASSKATLDDLRGTNLGLDSTKHQQNLALNEARLRNAALEQQVIDKDAVIHKMETMLEESRVSRAQLDDMLAVYKAENTKADTKLSAAAAEINKGNEIIRKLQSDVLALKSKIKLKNAILVQQEAALGDAVSGSAASSRAAEDLKAQLREKDAILNRTKSRVADMEDALTQAKAKLEENNNTIQFLNKRLNEKEAGQRNPFVGLVPLPRPSPAPHASSIPPAVPAVPSPSDSTPGGSAYSLRPSYFAGKDVARNPNGGPRVPLSAMPLPSQAVSTGSTNDMAGDASAGGNGSPAPIFSNTTPRYSVPPENVVTYRKRS